MGTHCQRWLRRASQFAMGIWIRAAIHEILNEINRDQVHQDILNWMEAIWQSGT